MAFPITTELIAAQARRLGEGSHRYTARQLYYASCAAADRPPPSPARSLTGCGVLLLLLAAALLWVHSVALTAALAGLGALTLLGALASALRTRGRVPGSRPLVESYDGFCGGPLRSALDVRPEAFFALLEPRSPAASAPEDPGEEAIDPGAGTSVLPAAGALVACDRSETELLLVGNAAHLPLMRVVTVDPAPGDADALALVVAGHRVVALHDADPRGCDLPARLRRAGALEVIDAGLSPPASDAGLQVIEGPPARLPEGLAAGLPADQVHWLSSGRRMELATLTPEEVLARVDAALAGAP
jgi:hypothetical protein